MSVLQRAVQLLDVLQTSDEGLSIRQIAERAELSKSAVQRILRELVETGLVTQDGTTRRYELGPRLLALSATYHRRLNVRQVALGHMTRLRDETGETVGLTIRAGEQIMHIEQAESRRDLRASFEIGQRLPLWSGAPSRLFLADETDTQVRAVLGRRSPADVQPIAAPDLQTELREIAAARSAGYATAFEETTRGVSTVSAPIHDRTGRVVATLSVMSPSGRMGESQAEGLAERLISVTRKISDELGWVEPVDGSADGGW